MAVYKVIQDIEAEDKLVGPLTLKGFIYALIAGFLAFLNFKLLLATELGYFRWPLVLIFALPMLLFGLLASPLGREQPTEVWLLSRVRFFLKPKRRIWDQSGISQLVTITVPKKVEQARTKGFSQSEVKSRLKTLAMTMDTRGWAVKNSNVNLTPEPGYLEKDEAGDSDRLVGVSNLPQATSTADVRPDDDILDEQNNPTARHFWDLLRIRDAERKQKNFDKMKAANTSEPHKPKARRPRRPHGQPAYHIPKDENLLNIKLQEAEKAFRTEHPEPTPPKAQQPSPKPEVTAASQAAKLELAQSGNDLSVASIQKLANRQPKVEQVGPGEVVISFR
jgi:hypothetical protein